ncbi:MAG: rhodanese-like domain-containing protein [Thermodesulfobacteriota bacterium]
MFALLALVLLLALAFAAANASNKFGDEVEKEKGAVKLAREAMAGGYGLVTAEELKKWIDEKKDMRIVDTMPFADSYRKEHVPGAVQFLFPIPEMKEWDARETDGKSQADYEALLGQDKDRTLVVYCGFVKCARSHNGAAWARKLGYRNVYRFAGGIFAWKGMDYPVDAVK